MAETDQGPASPAPANDLQPTRRLITTHNSSGQGVFAADDGGDHQRVIMGGKSSARIIYSTSSTPVDMNDEADLAFARNNEVSHLF